MTNALLVYPQNTPAEWGGSLSLDVLGIERVEYIPLGLLTVAAMFPPEYELRLVDMNVNPLTDEHLEWADLVFTSSMLVQMKSLKDVIARCNRAGVTVIAGGPCPTSYHEDLDGVDHFVLDEVEDTFAGFLRDLENGAARHMYRTLHRPDMASSPVPRFDLLNINNYFTMSVQFSRGCPFDCEFCDITKLFGKATRTKTAAQVIAEFDALYELGWRGNLFLVDDNFVGNKPGAMKLLPRLAEWQKERDYPFLLYTEASVNMARMDDLMSAMVEAGFKSVFLGIETPNPETLIKMKKQQNVYKKDENYLLTAVRKIQNKGMQITGGFILGADGDDESVFDAQVEFIQQAGIPYANVAVLTALKNTDLYKRLEQEKRLLKPASGSFFDVMNINFKPEMDVGVLYEGYQRVIRTIYDPTLDNFFERCLTHFRHVKFVPHLHKSLSESALSAATFMLRQRLHPRQLPAFTKFFDKVSREHPRLRLEALRLAGVGAGFQKVTDPASRTPFKPSRTGNGNNGNAAQDRAAAAA